MFFTLLLVSPLLLLLAWLAFKYVHYRLLCFMYSDMPGVQQFIPVYLARYIPSWLYNPFFRDPKQFTKNDMNKLHKRFDTVAKVIMGTQAMIFVNDPAIGARIDERGSRFYDKQQQLYVASQYFFGDSLFTAKYDNYQKHHKVLGHCFAADKMNLVVNTTTQVIKTYFEKLQQQNVRDVLQDMTCIATDVLGKVALEYDFDTLQNGLTDPYWKAEHEFSKNSPLFGFVPSLLWGLKLGFLGTMHQNADIIKQRMAHIIAQYKAKQPVNNGSFIAQLLAHENQELSSNEVISNIRSILLQGIPPVSRALTFCLYLLAKNPSVQQEAQHHADHIDVQGGALLKVNGHIAYIRNVIKETLRMFPVSTCQMRFTHHPLHIQKYSIPKHSWVVYNWANRESYYENPEQFNPDRFADDKELPPFVFSPFGVGSRACGGILFAEYEMTTVLVLLLQHFDLSIHQSYDMKTRVEQLYLRPIDDLFVTFTKRQK